MSFMRKLKVFVTVSTFAITFGLAPLNFADAASYSKPPSINSFRSSPSVSPSLPTARPTFGYSKPDTVNNKPDVPPTKPVDVVSPPRPTFGYSKPDTPSKPIVDKPIDVSPPKSNGVTPSVVSPTIGYTKPGASVPTTTNSTRVVQPSVLATQSSKVMSGDALAKYKAERAAAKAPPMAVDVAAAKRDPTFNSVTSRYSNINSYMSARDQSINVYRREHPDVYIIAGNMRPNYGAYDGAFLTGMLLGAIGNQVLNTNWLYAHQYDPWYAQWHADMLIQAQNNAELQAKITALDAQMAALKANSVSVNPSQASLPAGVDPALAIAPEAMIANATVNSEDSGGSHFMLYFGLLLVIIVLSGVSYLFIVGRKK